MRSIETFRLYNPKIIPNDDYEYPEFHMLNHHDYRRATAFEASDVYYNSLFWVPRFYHHYKLSDRFLEELNKLKNRTSWDDIDTLALIQLCLTEATYDTSYKFAFKYKAEFTKASAFHGIIDMLIYNDVPERKYLPIIPVMFPGKGIDELTGFPFDSFNMTSAVCAGLWGLDFSKAAKSDPMYVRSIQTNGVAWRFFEVHSTTVKKTQLFSIEDTTSGNLVKRTLANKAFLKKVIGMIRYSIGIEENIPQATSGNEIKKAKVIDGETGVEIIANKNYKDMYETKSISDISNKGKILEEQENDVKKIEGK